MRPKITRYATKVTFFATVVLATCLLGGLANAQSIQGKFTLPYETHWGKAVLPAGDYVVAFTHDNTPPMLVIRDAKSRRVVGYESLDVRENSTKESALLIRTRGKEHVVYSITIAEIGEAFLYPRIAVQGRSAEEAGQTQAVPVVVAKK